MYLIANLYRLRAVDFIITGRTFSLEVGRGNTNNLNKWTTEEYKDK